MRRLNPPTHLSFRRRWRRRPFRLFRTRRRVWRGLFWVTLISLAALPSLHWANRWLYQQHRAKAEPLLHSLQPAVLGDCVVIIAPHPDDETLQAGGLVAWLTRNGLIPHILVVTDGDGYDAAIKLLYHELHITEAHRHAFALRRRRETLEAMALLGVPSDHVHFLGFSERALPTQWLTQGDDRLLKGLMDRLTTLQPTAVILPSRYDDHPVHTTVCSLTWAALLQAVASGSLPKMPYVLEALVHYGEFPRPQGWHPDWELLPPADLLTVTRWWRFGLPKEIRDRKGQAIASYRTQLPLSGRFLKSFVRANELFAEPLPLWRQPDRAGEPRSLLPFIDLTEVALFPLRPGWQLQMRLRGKPHKGYRYGVHWFIPATPRPFLAVTDALPSGTTEKSILVSAMPFDTSPFTHQTSNPMAFATVVTAFVAHGRDLIDIAPLTVGTLIRQKAPAQPANMPSILERPYQSKGAAQVSSGR